MSWEEEEEWEDEEWEEESDESGDSGAAPYAGLAGRPLAIGALSVVPLLVAYEASLGTAVEYRRNTAEMLLGMALRPLGDFEAHGRWVLIGLVAVVALLGLRGGLRRCATGWARIPLEGALAAVVLGPLLLLLQNGLGGGSGAWFLPDAAPERVPSLARIGFVAGGAGYEEIVFRLGIYTACYFLARAVAEFFGAPRIAQRLFADVAALGVSSGLFALAHFEGVADVLGYQGAPFERSLFLWYLGSGAILALLFRLRGIGVAAWAHALFNAAIVLGAGPGVFR